MAKVKKSGLAVAMTVILAVAAAGYFFIDQANRDKARAAAASAVPPGIPVTVGFAEKKDMPVYVRGIGTVQAFKMVVVKTRVDGQIMKVAFEEGQEVKAGDPLFQIDPRPFQAALDQATAAKQRSEAQLVGAAARPRALRQADRLGLPVAPELRPAEGDSRRAEGSDRRRPGRDRHRQAQPRLCRHPRADRRPHRPAPGRSRQPRAGQPEHRAGHHHPDQADLRELHGAAGSHGRRSAATRPIAPLAVIAYASDDKTELGTGKVTLIDNQIDAATGTLRLKGTFENTDERLWPGEFVNARLVLSTRKDAVTVPQRAVMQGANGYFVYVVKPDNTVERRTVEVRCHAGRHGGDRQGPQCRREGRGRRPVPPDQRRQDQGRDAEDRPAPRVRPHRRAAAPAPAPQSRPQAQTVHKD